MPVDRRHTTVNGHQTADGRIAAVAGAQHGVITAAQVLECGLREGGLRHRVRAGRLHRIHLGVYAVGHGALAPQGRLMAAVLACGPGAVVSHTSAAELWGLLDPGHGRCHVLAPGMSGGRRGPASVTVHRTHALTDADVTTRDGVPITTVPRTLADLAAIVDGRQLARAVHEAEVLRLLDRRAVHALLALLPRRHGAARLRRLILAGDPDVHSERFVEVFLRLCSRHGLPDPEVAVDLQTPDGVFEADIFFRRQRLVVELDGERFHDTRKKFHSDRRRDSALAAEGIQTVRLTWHRVAKDGARTATQLRRILATRSDAS